MYYAAITVSTKPGMRFQGIEHLKKFADWIEGKYNIEIQVLGNMNGRIYRNHVVSRYENLAQLETTYEKVLADDEYLKWFKEGKDLIEWGDATQEIYQVF
jgi:hypothetical protein